MVLGRSSALACTACGVGLGAGGTEFLALDLSHMSPSSPDGPFEILWTSEDAAVKADYDAYAGQTWARPALTYEVPEDRLTEEPSPRLVITTGYPGAGAGDQVADGGATGAGPDVDDSADQGIAKRHRFGETTGDGLER